MKNSRMTRAERAQLAMMLEVCAYPKPGNVDRCHDYETTFLEHFRASTILVKPAFERAERGEGGIGSLIHDAVRLTNSHSGGNTHFGAYILLIPLILGGDINGAIRAVAGTDVSDALEFYAAFGLTQVRVIGGDELDVHDPASRDAIRARGMTLLDIMRHSAENDMVAREWTNEFCLTRRMADLLHASGSGRSGITSAFLRLLAEVPDTFVAKKHGLDIALRTMQRARGVLAVRQSMEEFDAECISAGINPGSIADITIAGIYTALGEGWEWDS